MKKILVVLALAAFASTASATIEGSRHDLSKMNGATLGSCAYCHAPHLWVATNLPAGTTPPLWNRNSQAASAYSIWSSQYLHTDYPGTRSLTCLSCHDGSQDLGQVNNGAYGSLGNIAAVGNVGMDLTNDHPVGAVYSTTDTELVQPPTNGIRLRSGKVECSSCHDPHDTTNGPNGGRFFLRTTTELLCGSCHLK